MVENPTLVALLDFFARLLDPVHNDDVRAFSPDRLCGLKSIGLVWNLLLRIPLPVPVVPALDLVLDLHIHDATLLFESDVTARLIVPKEF